MNRARKVARLVPRALSRVILGTAIGLATGALLSVRYSLTIAVLGGWNAAGLTMLAFAWLVIAGADAEMTSHRAAAEDRPGRTTITVVILLGALAGFVAVTVLVRRPAASAPMEQLELVVLCFSTAIVSWTLTHTAFALRYADLFYRRDPDRAGGVEFPGGARPSYLDFAYLAFTVGMTFQVSDTAISNPRIRHTVLLHSVLSFFYTTTILAFVINLVAGIAGAQS